MPNYKTTASPTQFFMPVDYGKLVQAFKQRKRTLAEAGRQMGHSDGYLQGVKYNGRLNTGVVKMLESMFGIAYDTIKPDEHAETTEPEKAPEQKAEPSIDCAEIKALTECVELLTEQLKAHTEAMTRIAESGETFKALLAEPVQLYKAIFIPMYNALRAAAIDNAKDEKDNRR